MKIILVFVSTLDGKVTKWGDPKVSAWSSESDKKFFTKTWNEAKLIVMGSKTFRAEHLALSRNNLLVVMTKNTSEYASQVIKDKLEFSDESPAQLVSRLENMGFEQMMLVGGPKIATSYLKEHLVDEIWLTLEPRIFGSGGNLVVEEKLDIVLDLLSCDRVNEQGTLITKYAVRKN